LGSDLLVALGWAFDYISFVFLLWNLCCVGIAVIFYRGPLWLQQVYLVVMSSMMAFSLTALADLTTWILLGFLALWDLVAVLCPFGPLRILLETSREQNREIPALLYTAMATPGRPPDPDSTVDGETDGVAADEDDGEAGESDADDDAEADERNNLKLGLGDFVFYSVLIARAAVFDWVTTIACVVVVMMGLNITIFLLVIYRKALPALPISIAFGILFYFASSKTLAPMVNGLVYLPDGRPALTNASIFVGRFGGAGAVYI
ncbi:hypothetical protein CXG81DRAFT_8372, partial [Caulochytrium protostelioides]